MHVAADRRARRQVDVDMRLLGRIGSGCIHHVVAAVAHTDGTAAARSAGVAGGAMNRAHVMDAAVARFIVKVHDVILLRVFVDRRHVAQAVFVLDTLV
jgi:hypothetical protein